MNPPTHDTCGADRNREHTGLPGQLTSTTVASTTIASPTITSPISDPNNSKESTDMNDLTMPMAVWLSVAYGRVRQDAVDLWTRLADDRGADESTSRLLWIVAGVAIAIAATTVAVAVFNAARDQVNESPVAPTP